MPAPYSTDFRLKVVNSYLEKGSLRKTAEKFDVSYKFVQTSVRRYKIENTVEPEPHKSGNPPKSRSIHHLGFLKKLIASENDLSLNDICARFKNKFSGNISVTGMHESLKRIGISRKKKAFTIRKKARI